MLRFFQENGENVYLKRKHVSLFRIAAPIVRHLDFLLPYD